MKYAEIIVNLAAKNFNKSFTYIVPDSMEAQAEFGKRVIVEFGKKNLEGFIVNLKKQCEVREQLKPILKVIDEEPIIDKKLWELALWIADYYICPLPRVLNIMVPGLLNKKKSKVVIPLVSKKVLESFSSPVIEKINPDFINRLTSDGEITVNEAKKLLSVDNLRYLEKSNIITFANSYKVRPRAKTGYVYAINKFDFKQIPGLKKRAPRQAEAIEMLLKYKQIDRELLEKTIPKTSLESLLDKGYIKLERKNIKHRNTTFDLNEEQQAALDKIKKNVEVGTFSEILLYGVTGSGKTEVYIHSAQEVINRGRKVVILVPEIALTRHLVETFSGRITNMAVLHSGMPQGERYDQWKKIKDGEIDLVLGTRSAVLAPLDNIGLIIIDEEQETTFKQEETPRYHAREVAAWRARMDSAVLLVGSATPSIESFYKAMNGSMQLITLKNRVGVAKIPNIIVTDMRNQFKQETARSISPFLKEKISETLDRHEQIILFINRRGYSPITVCLKCGKIASCPSCSVGLTYHIDVNQNICHYCDYHTPIPVKCTICGSNHIQQVGFGTQKVEQEVKKIFPFARIRRLDLDSSRKKDVQKNILKQMKNKQIDILIGTQMVAKGLDFPDVSLVGIIEADSMLNLPDFRAAERCFQLIVQAAGRAGRGELPGEVVIQTYNPENPVIKMAAGQDYFNFYKEEIKLRKLLHYPPFTNILRVVVSYKEESLARQACLEIADYIQEITDAQEDDITILGPAPCPISKIRNRYRYQILVKCDNFLLISSIAKYIIYRGIRKDIKIELDINPVMTM